MSKPTVAFLSPNTTWGGAEKAFYHQIRFARDVRPLAIFLKPRMHEGPEDLVAEIERLGHPVFLPTEPLRLRSLAIRPGSIVEPIARFCREHEASMIFSHLSYGHLFGARIARTLGIKSAWIQHGPVSAIDRWASLIATDRVLFNSHRTRAEHFRFTPRHFRPRNAVIYAPVDPPNLPSLPRDVRAELGLGKDSRLILHLGRIQEWKGQMEFLKAFARLAAEHDSHAILIGSTAIGSVKYLESLKIFAETPELRGRVHFIGFDADLASWFQQCDLFVQTSLRAEPFGLTLAEAAASGLDVISSGHSGLHELVDMPIIDPRETEALANAMHDRLQKHEPTKFVLPPILRPDIWARRLEAEIAETLRSA